MREAATKDAKKLTKRTGKSVAAQGENTEISARKALKIRKMPMLLNTAKCYENTNLEYTKHIKDTYYNKNHQKMSSKQQVSSTNKITDEMKR